MSATSAIETKVAEPTIESLTKQVEALEAKNRTLEKRVKSLTTKNEALEQELDEMENEAAGSTEEALSEILGRLEALEDAVEISPPAPRPHAAAPRTASKRPR